MVEGGGMTKQKGGEGDCTVPLNWVDTERDNGV